MHLSFAIVIMLLLSASFVATTVAAQTSKSVDANLSQCPQENAKVARQRSAEEQASITRSSGKVVRRGTTLELRSRDRLVVLRDDCTNGEAYARYTFSSFLSESGYYLISITGWEGSGSFLISDRTGERTNIEGSPVFSPDGKRFITLSMDLEAGENDNAIQIWRISSAGLTIKSNVFMPNWIMPKIGWLNRRSNGPRSASRPGCDLRTPRRNTNGWREG